MLFTIDYYYYKEDKWYIKVDQRFTRVESVFPSTAEKVSIETNGGDILLKEKNGKFKLYETSLSKGSIFLGDYDGPTITKYCEAAGIDISEVVGLGPPPKETPTATQTQTKEEISVEELFDLPSRKEPEEDIKQVEKEETPITTSFDDMFHDDLIIELESALGKEL